MEARTFWLNLILLFLTSRRNGLISFGAVLTNRQDKARTVNAGNGLAAVLLLATDKHIYVVGV